MEACSPVCCQAVNYVGPWVVCALLTISGLLLGGSLLLLFPLSYARPASKPRAVAGRLPCTAVSVREKDLNADCTSLLGFGSHGAVYKGCWEGAPVAVKLLRIEAQEGLEHASGRAPHLDLGSVLLHPSLVQLYAYTVRPATTHRMPSPLHFASLSEQANVPHAARLQRPQATMVGNNQWELVLVNELCDKGTLRDHIDVASHLDKSHPTCQLALKLATLLEIARGVAFLHAAGRMHGDLKSSNVLLKHSNLDQRGFSAKLGDYGLSPFLPRVEQSAKGAQFTAYTHVAPEVLRSGVCSPAGDAYAFGVLMAELHGGSRALDQPSQCDAHWDANPLQSWAEYQKAPASFGSDCPSAYRAIAQQCWAADPINRPTFPGIIQRLSAAEQQLQEKSVVEEIDILFNLMNDRGDGSQATIDSLSLHASSADLEPLMSMMPGSVDGDLGGDLQLSD